MVPEIDTFDQSTNRSAVILGFQVHYLQPDTIGVIPNAGYGNKYNQSTEALQWLVTLEVKEGKKNLPRV